MKNDGRYLEQAVEDELKKITRVGFHWRRLYDTKAARNVLPAQPSDYFISNHGTTVHLEVKSQQGKTKRLKKFSQLADMQRWRRAGVEGYVLVHFYELDEIYLVNVSNLEFGKPSWVLSESDRAESIEQALRWVGASK